MTIPTSSQQALDAEALLHLFSAAAAHLHASAAAVDAINVYPVPDGDTGSNMAATLAEAVRMAQAAPRTVEGVAAGLARGGLYGARGNSGVILSQALRGFAAALSGAAAVDGDTLAKALTRGADGAYAAVDRPMEGTMLTVLRAAGRGASTAAGGVREVLMAAVAAAEEAEGQTRYQLPMLAEAGVTDAGGEGVCVILRAMLAATSGEVVAVREPEALPRLDRVGQDHDTFGFCAEFIVEADARPVDLDALRSVVSAGTNRSVVIVGDPQAAHVHVHTDDPDALLGRVRTAGTVSRVKVEDMSAQHLRFARTGSGATARCAVLALSPGPGFDLIFEQLGVHTTDLGTQLKPSAGDIAAAVDALRSAEVVVLPNHKNVLRAATLAADLATCVVHVVPTESLPQGIAAAMACDVASSATDNIGVMAAAARTVRTVEVTLATGDRHADGFDVRAGDAIALLDDVLVAAGDSELAVLVAALERAGCTGEHLITVYTGAVSPPAAEVEASLVSAFPGAEVQVLSGGQELYSLIASVE